MENYIIELLFETNAIQVCPEGDPFFYTSGKLGPYYINTHYLFGTKEKSEEFLTVIEESKKDLKSFTENMFKAAYKQYLDSEIYRAVIDIICDKVKEYDVDYISGGERRDFFFSILPSNILDIPNISILKDKTCIISTPDLKYSRIAKSGVLKGKRVLHIADLVTEASSYVRAWIPAIEKLGAVFEETISVVDRNQGGVGILNEKNISLFSFALINKELFKHAKKNGFISDRQCDMILDFIENPDRFMYEFLDSNPDFLENKISQGGKLKERALLCKNIYETKDTV